MRLAGPNVGTQVGLMAMGAVDTMMVGRVSTEALGAAAIGNVWVALALFSTSGLILGVDPIVSQAHGAGRGDRAGLALQSGTVLALVLTLPVVGLFLLTRPVLLAAGQDPGLAAAAHEYLIVQIPGIPALLLYTALRQYLQGRTIVQPALWVVVVANVLNVFANYALIFGHFGFPAMGLVGAGIATAVVRIFSLVALLAIAVGLRLHEGAWQPWSRASLSLRKLGAIVRLGVPVWLQLLFEMGAFSGTTLLAGRLSVPELASHAVVLNLSSLSFMVPLGLSSAASTRVGNLIGARDPGGVQQSVRVALLMGAGVMAVAGVIFVAGRELLPRLYSPDTVVIAACASILPVAAAFQIFDGTQVVATGILRGMGRTRPAAIANFVGYWVVGLPLGAFLAFTLDIGLAGIWWGLAGGLALVSIALVIRVLLDPTPAQTEL